MISDIDLTLPDDADPKSTLDDVIRQFKQNVKESFPNVNAEVGVTGKQLNQLLDNDFDSTITEAGTEVAKLSGARFTGQVINPDGSNPTQPNQLVTKAYVDAAIAAVWPPAGDSWEDFLVATTPDFYWPLQETGPPTVNDLSGNGYDGEYFETLNYSEPSIVPSVPDRKSVDFPFIAGAIAEYGSITGTPEPLPSGPTTLSFQACVRPKFRAANIMDIAGIEGKVAGKTASIQLLISGFGFEADRFVFSITTDTGTFFYPPLQAFDSELIVWDQEYLLIGRYDDVTKEAALWVGTPTELRKSTSITADPIVIPTEGRVFAGDGSGAISDVIFWNDNTSDAGASIIYDKWLNG